MLSREQVEKIQKEKLMSRAEIRKFDREWTEVCDRLRRSREKSELSITENGKE